MHSLSNALKTYTFLSFLKLKTNVATLNAMWKLININQGLQGFMLFLVNFVVLLI